MTQRVTQPTHAPMTLPYADARSPNYIGGERIMSPAGDGETMNSWEEEEEERKRGKEKEERKRGEEEEKEKRWGAGLASGSR